MALGYPSPHLIKADQDAGLSAQFDSRLYHLNEISLNRADDLVLLADGHAIWFQLRPQILVSRFLASDKASNTVMLAGVPDDDDLEGYGSVRADVVMGTVEAVRQLVQEAKIVSIANPELKAIHEVYDYLYQAQEMRKAAKRSSDSDVTGGPSNDTISMVLDQTGGVVFANDPAEAQVMAASPTASSEQYARSDSSQQRLLADDIRTSLPPFWTRDLTDLPRDEVWEDQPLLCHPKTAHVPAVVLRDAEATRDPKVEAQQWSSTWLAPHLSSMYHINELITEGPVAFAGGRFWWPNRPADLKFRLSSPGMWTVEQDVYGICGSVFEFRDVTEPKMPGEE